MTISNTMERPAAQGPDRTDRNMRDPNKRMLRDAMTKALKIADEYLADVIKNIGEDQQPKVIYIGLMDAANSDGLFPCDGYAPECLRMDAIRAIDRHCGEGYASEHLDLYGLFRRITGSLW